MTEVPPLSLTAQLGGRVLAGRYRLDHLVATGGMAHVWEATDHVLGRRVAVKILHAHLAADEVFVARFRQEAVAAAKVSHPAIVSMYDTISADGGGDIVALVMQYVPGRTLRQVLDEHPRQEPGQIVPLVATVAEALEAAHRQGVIHRDVKPANLLLDPDGQVHVADFGIAKAVNSADLTDTGVLLGTARYLAPEQVRGEPADHRSDIYALSALLYEALAGRPPFDGPNEMAIALARLQRDPVPLGQIRPDVPEAIRAVVARGLARDPDHRYEAAEDFRVALLGAWRAAAPDGDQPALVFEEPTPTPTPTFTETERTWLVPTALLLVVAVALGVAGLLLSQTGTGARIYDRVRDVVGVPEAAPGDSSSPSEPITPAVDSRLDIVAATSFDPFGSGSPPSEHDELTALLHDGDPTTAWTTESYSSAAFGNLKPGVGVIVSIGAPTSLDGLELTTTSQGWSFEIYTATSLADTIENWGPVRARADAGAGSVAIDLDGPEASHVLVWITSLDPTIAPHRVSIGEIGLV